jgi:hypothetical protein
LKLLGKIVVLERGLDRMLWGRSTDHNPYVILSVANWVCLRPFA